MAKYTIFKLPLSLVVMVIFILISSSSLDLVQCVQLDVGGDKLGWATPSAKGNDQLYNDWAATNRFKVNDTLKFEYKKDSVLVVTKEEYEKCRSSHPMFFSNSGDTVYTLDRPGLYYFISGVADHCNKGLKMIVKVLEPQSSPDTAAPTKNAAVQSPIATVLPIIVAVSVIIGSIVM